MLKKILFVLLIIIGLAVVISFLMPGTVHVEKSIEINQKVGVVFPEVSILKNWKNWSYWDQIDTAQQSVYSGPESGVGAKHEWKSENENVGEGYMLVVEETVDQKIVYDLGFGSDVSQGVWLFEATETGTKVTMSMDMDLGMNPIGRYMGGMLKGMLEPDFEKNLNNLKAHCEKLNALPEITVETIEITEKQYFLAIKQKTELVNLQAVIGQSYGEISAFMAKAKIEPTGAPLARTFTWNPPLEIEMEMGIPIKDSVKTSGNIYVASISPCKAVTTVHMGDYNKMEETYNKLEEWMKMSNVQVAGAPWEVYTTDPGMEPDTNKWQTTIFFPIQ